MTIAPPELKQPRFFWRRVFAVSVDWALVSFLTTLLLLPFLRPDETGLRLAGAPMTFSTCRNVTSVSQEIADLVAPEVIAKGTLCEIRPFLIYNGRTLNLVYALNETHDGAVRTSTSRTLSVALNGKDEVVSIFAPQTVLVPLLLMIFSAMFIARKGQTPGKMLMKIKVVGTGCPVCREARRLGLFVVLGAASFAIGAAPAGMLSKLALTPVWAVVGFGFAIFAAFFWMYLLPMIRWRGVMPYDRATGFYVARTIKE